MGIFDTLALLPVPWFLMSTPVTEVDDGWMRLSHLSLPVVDLGALLNLLPNLPIILPTVSPGHLGGVSCVSVHRLLAREFPLAERRACRPFPSVSAAACCGAA